MEGKQYRIGTVAAGLLIILAIIFDILTLIPIVGDFLGPLFWVMASIYFWKIGMGFVNGRKLAVTLISLVAELIPVIQEFPAILLGIIVVIVMTRIEDRTGVSLSPTKKPGVTAPRIQRAPVNATPGVRPPRLPQ